MTRIVGIGGGSGAGKSTLAKALCRALGPQRVHVIPCDAYYRDRGELAAAARAALNFDHPDALELDQLARDLVRLRSGSPIEQPVYDFATHRRTRDVVVLAPRPYLVVEGVLALTHAQLRACFDVSVFVTATEALRFERRLARDQSERGRSADSVHTQYRKTVQPMHERFVEPSRDHADHVVDTGLDEAALGAVVARLLEGL